MPSCVGLRNILWQRQAGEPLRGLLVDQAPAHKELDTLLCGFDDLSIDDTEDSGAAESDSSSCRGRSCVIQKLKLADQFSQVKPEVQLSRTVANLVIPAGCSSSNRNRLRSSPPPYPVNDPPAPTTRWQGATMLTGLRPTAWPTH